MEDIYCELRYPLAAEFTEFYRDIWPVLSGTYALSWVNGKAFQGHGPGGKGDFLPLEVQLSEPNPIYLELRQQIFDRLRNPNTENDEEATTKFMPRLSGDDGDAIEPGDIYEKPKPIRRFAALTKLQYARFEQWKDGNFITGSPHTQAGFNSNVHVQPEYLTRAVLEQTIGDPLYPGIEMWWIAKDAKIYDLSGKAKPLFRMNYREDKVKPGYLSRGLSLPWQSDFDLCNTHWWPSNRPDDVVTKASFQLSNDTRADDKAKLVQASIKRKNWTRGLRNTEDPISFPGSTDMVRYWKYLGFVKKDSANVYVEGVEYPLYLESERRQLPVPVVVPHATSASYIV
jgi:hypothetical protein